jgi:hypothetical protein
MTKAYSRAETATSEIVLIHKGTDEQTGEEIR